MDRPAPLAVYLHWPYCARICPYCDFNVYRDRREGEADALAAAMVADLAHWRDWTGSRTIGSVHFGGGTPSLLTESQLTGLLGAIETQWGLPDGAEVALEANPNDITDERLGVWERAGLSRLSIGVQSFNDAVLARLGRDHDGAQARQTVTKALSRFASVSADLIFGVAGEGEGRLYRDLDALLDLGVPHISTYQLTVEPGTAFARSEARGEDRAVDDDRSADAFARIQARLRTEGYRHYEVSNFAKAGHESQHNLAYWRGHDYVGVGPGAHGRLWTNGVRMATEARRLPRDYIDAARTGRASEATALSGTEAAEEYVLMGLRINEGVSLDRLAELRGAPVAIDPALIADGLLRIEKGRLMATSSGRFVLDALTRAIVLG